VLKIPFFSKREFFSTVEKNQVVAAIKEAEKQTSGEIRVYVESHCRYVDPLDRAAEVFLFLKMKETIGHNAVLIYVAVGDRQLAVFGDVGIHEKVGDLFWKQKVEHMLTHFQEEGCASAIVKIVLDIGAALKYHFPYDRQTDVNELPDDIVFGR
jgi:uncharacterized membrane protein